eukprot:TRINITY_DN63402_c0_g1_i2.p1 TRINITY_DN63402_c0_g1~~TRINITY_DN63402_c0_g1_i2.p1  ORF type:complete len:739 (+),score=121.13 TRINITY_DN63402_c0_g1_i2:100-2217(+)
MLANYEVQLLSAVVFVDDIYADMFTCNNLMPTLLHTLQVLTVTSFDTLLSYDEYTKTAHLEDNKCNKACFFTTQPLHEVQHIIEQTTKTYFFEQVYVFTAQREDLVLRYGAAENAVTYSEFQAKLHSWILQGQVTKSALKKQVFDNTTVEASIMAHVMQFPLFHKTITSRVFTMPVCKDTFPIPADPALCALAKSGDCSVDTVDGLQATTKGKLHLLAYALDTTLDRFGFGNYTPFSIGTTSALIGSILQEKKEAQHTDSSSISLVLVDRTLDLVAPLCHSDNPLDRLQSAQHQYKEQVKSEGEDAILNTAFQPSWGTEQDEDLIALLDALATKKYKEALLYMRNECIKLVSMEVDGMQAEITQLNTLWNDTFFAGWLDLFDSNMEKQCIYTVYYEHSTFIEFVRAAFNAIRGTQKEYQQHLSFENVLMWHTTNATNSALTPLLQSLHDAHQKKGTATEDSTLHAPTSIIQKAMALYSLFGVSDGVDDTLHTETVLQIEALLTDAVVRPKSERQKQLQHYFLPDGVNKDSLSVVEVQKYIHAALDTAMMLENQRYINGLHVLNSLLTAEDQTECGVLGKMTPYTPLLKQLAHQICLEQKLGQPTLKGDCMVHKAASKIDNIVQHTKQSGGWFGGGMGMLGKILDHTQHHQQIGEASVVVIFVVGGITFGEIHDVVDAFKSSGKTVYVGGTCVSNGIETVQSILRM